MAQQLTLFLAVPLTPDADDTSLTCPLPICRLDEEKWLRFGEPAKI